jgi:hypothetical protein
MTSAAGSSGSMTIAMTMSGFMNSCETWFMEKYKGGLPDNYKARTKEIAFVQKFREAVRSLKSN